MTLYTSDGQAANRVVRSLTEELGNALATIERVETLADRWAASDESGAHLCESELREALNG